MDLGLTQWQVAELFGADESTVYNWEHARTRPQLRAKQLTRFLKEKSAKFLIT